MKKLLLGLGIALIACSCDQKKEQSASTYQAAPAPAAAGKKKIPLLYTLNGYPLAEADVMVESFLKNKGVYDEKNRADFWFSAQAIDTITNILNREAADGVRVYFAKNATGQFEIMLVSTRPVPQRQLDSTKLALKYWHMDYFEHKAQFLANPVMRGVPDNKPDSQGNLNAGAELYTRTPLNCSDDGCNTSNPSFVSCKEAQQRVLNYDSNTAINTYSEWYDKPMVDSLNVRLKRSQGKLDGIRIYINRRTTTGKRHGFLWVVTEAAGNLHKDRYDCLDNFVYWGKGIKQTQDNGEQCPNNCEEDTWPD